MRPSSLSNEVQVAWNGLSEFSRATEDIIKEAIEKYFETTQTGIRFYESHEQNHKILLESPIQNRNVTFLSQTYSLLVIYVNKNKFYTNHSFLRSLLLSC